MPIRGPLVLAVALADLVVVCGLDGNQPIESNWQGKFWYSGIPSLVTHLNISAELGDAEQRAMMTINAAGARLHVSYNEWRT